MPEKPRIFVSSTIADFRDLRLALKYWLEEAGFEVLLSECNDFPVDSELSTFENCLAHIRQSQYVLLLVGFRYGALFDAKNGVSVTRKEYREAYSQALAGRAKLLSLVRAAVPEAISTGDSSKFTEPGGLPLVKNFLEEIRKDAEVQEGSRAGGPFPRANWLYRFATFRDVVEAVGSSLRIGANLRKRAIEANLLWELKSNLQLLLNKSKGKIVWESWPLRKLQAEIKLTKDDLGRNIELSIEHARVIAWAGTYMVFNESNWLATSSLNEAIESGEFLQFDHQLDRFVVSSLQSALLKLRSEIDRLKKTSTLFGAETIMEHLSKIAHSPEPAILGAELAQIFHTANTFHNVVSLNAGLIAFFEGLNPELASWPLAPETPLEDSARRFQENRPTVEEVENWVTSFFRGEGDTCERK